MVSDGRAESIDIPMDGRTAREGDARAGGRRKSEAKKSASATSRWCGGGDRDGRTDSQWSARASQSHPCNPGLIDHPSNQIKFPVILAKGSKSYDSYCPTLTHVLLPWVTDFFVHGFPFELQNIRITASRGSFSYYPFGHSIMQMLKFNYSL